jgi:BirA family transcriptional regulator, biotin operon repressor / biotin---[acetyl-CoA-carboxylase] ligase
MIGAPRVHHSSCDSTNERARELAAAGAPHGTLVTAGEQTAGRGRQGRTWSAPPGSAVLMSLVLRDLGEGDAALPLAAAVTVCQACESLAPVECRIKWPNDVWVDGRKLAGILVEGRPQDGWAVLGIGLNVTTAPEQLPDELRETATSLAIAARGEPPPTEQVLAEVLRSLERTLARDSSEVLEAWRGRDALLGSPVSWTDGEGVAAGIDDSGALLVDTGSGRVALAAGEVHLERPGAPAA